MPDHHGPLIRQAFTPGRVHPADLFREKKNERLGVGACPKQDRLNRQRLFVMPEKPSVE